jgi:glycosyltransferase involved in cell wall biosynthesis
VFLCIGFIGEHKGFDRAVHAFAQLPEGSAQLLVIGSLLYEDNPSARAYLDALSRLTSATPGALLEERYLSDSDFDLYIRAASVVILPYRFAASSGVAARARLLGTKVIAAAVGGLPEQVGSGNVVVETDEELATALRACTDTSTSRS